MISPEERRSYYRRGRVIINAETGDTDDYKSVNQAKHKSRQLKKDGHKVKVIGERQKINI